MILDIHSEKEFDQEIGDAKGYVLLDFYAVWCRPCKMMGVVLEKADAAVGDRVKFCRINTEEMEDLTERFDLVGVPTFILFKDGKETGRIIGYNDTQTFLGKLEKLMEKQ